jgi:uncharacterized protein YbaR (Trm112 family)
MTTYDLPSISTKDYWVSVTDVPCPVCKGGVLRWAESGYVPGYRICDRCGRHFRADGSRERPAVIEEENQGGWLADQLMEYRRTLAAKLKSYGAVLIQSDGRLVCEMTDPNDNAKTVYQYRVGNDLGVERRRLQRDKTPFLDGSPWESCEIPRPEGFHPVLDALNR